MILTHIVKENIHLSNKNTYIINFSTSFFILHHADNYYVLPLLRQYCYNQDDDGVIVRDNPNVYCNAAYSS